MVKEKFKGVAFFEGKNIRRHWDSEKELWYFSVVGVVSVLTGTSVPRRYWSDLKIKLRSEGSEVYEKILDESRINPPRSPFDKGDVRE